MRDLVWVHICQCCSDLLQDHHHPQRMICRLHESLADWACTSRKATLDCGAWRVGTKTVGDFSQVSPADWGSPCPTSPARFHSSSLLLSCTWRLDKRWQKKAKEWSKPAKQETAVLRTAQLNPSWIWAKAFRSNNHSAFRGPPSSYSQQYWGGLPLTTNNRPKLISHWNLYTMTCGYLQLWYVLIWGAV